ncbi:hypothetical protein [Gynuella sunshinyii]|nr:hypothetical protein [Gynuella sunshinyii]
MEEVVKSNKKRRLLILAVIFLSLSLLGQFSAILIPAITGEAPAVNSLGGMILWTGLLFLSVWSLNGKKKLVGFIVGAVVGLLVNFSVGVFAGYNNAKFDSIAEAVEASNANLPRMIDDETRLDSVAIDQTAKQYYFRMSLVDFEKQEIDLEFLEENFVEFTKPSTCEITEFQVFFSEGYTINYVYSDKTAQLVSSFSIQAGDCGE